MKFKSIILILLMTAGAASAQIITGGVLTNLMVPVNNFQQHQESAILNYGIEAGITKSFDYPFWAGIEYLRSDIAQTENNVPILVNGVRSTGNLNLASTINTVNAKVRFSPLHTRVKPYVGAIGGFKVFNTKTEYTTNIGIYQEDESIKYNNVEIEEKLVEGASYNFGLEVGGELEITNNLYLNASFSKIFGGTSKYVASESLQINQLGYASYDIVKTETNTINFNVGVVYKFKY